MKSVTGTMSAVESSDDFIRAPTDAEGFLAAARTMLEGARVLASASQVPAIALSHLCGHAAESALKAMLSQVGVPTIELSKPALGHKLTNLWARAVAEGISLPKSQDAWFERLHRVHATPYTLRYPLGLHAIVLPDSATMLRGVEELISKAAACVQ
ncbi:hypothetical protein [Paucibacter sp. B51]|uniref:hypothetical protein n=1 Tax=Paucibacter sp. B51 TaxID=2993315 RepID=UPI0022EBDE7E|nr:hypothetical protein [Paucibacter sp. B51]